MRVALCGLGNMGTNHLRILEGLPECKLAALVDPDSLRRRQLARSKPYPVFARLDQALAATRPDVVVIAAPTETHFELASLAVRSGVAIFVEKPFTRSLEEGRKLLRLIRARKARVMVGHIERFNPASISAKSLISKRQLGEIVNISIRRVGGTPRDIKRAGDVLVDLAVHDIDLVSWLLGREPKLVDAVGHRGKVVDSATLLMRCGKSAVDLNVNWVTPVKIREILITGTLGVLQLNLISQSAEWLQTNRVLTGQQSATLGFDRFLTSFLHPRRRDLPIVRSEPLAAELAAFLKAVRSDEPMPVTAEEGFAALVLAEAAKKRVLTQLRSAPS